MIRDYRKPLIVIAPKILLRHPAAISPLSDFKPQTSFKTIIGMLYFFLWLYKLLILIILKNNSVMSVHGSLWQHMVTLMMWFLILC